MSPYWGLSSLKPHSFPSVTPRTERGSPRAEPGRPGKAAPSWDRPQPKDGTEREEGT